MNTVPLYDLIKFLAVVFVGAEQAVGISATTAIANFTAKKLAGSVDSLDQLYNELGLNLSTYMRRGNELYLVGYECPARVVYYNEGLNPCTLCRLFHRSHRDVL